MRIAPRAAMLAWSIVEKNENTDGQVTESGNGGTERKSWIQVMIFDRS